MAGPLFRSNGARATSAGAATIAPAKPTVDGAGGILLAVVTSKNNATHSCSTSGWVQIGVQVNSGASFTASLWVAAESAAAPTFTWTGSVACSAQISYYTDPANSVFIGSSVIGAASTGTTSPHSSAAITTDAANTLAILIDVAAANTALTAPSGWALDVSNGSATDVGRTTFGSKSVATSATSTGAVSSAGAAAAWVQWQIELKGATAAAGLSVSKADAKAFLEPPAGLSVSKAGALAWIETSDMRVSKMEAVAWLDRSASIGRRRQLING
jgi:hypothetical protein